MNLTKWLRIAFFNILIVAALGVILRYKIAFSLPFIEQKKILHAHSHFAFGGWISQALMAFIVLRLSVVGQADLFKRYNGILWANLVCSYGMLIGFILQGYGFYSILFSTCSIFTAYIFMYYVWQDINRCTQRDISFPWFKAATLFNSLSSVGAFTLAYMMAKKSMNQDVHLASIYFFLHFQYNGWFSFTVLGLLSGKLYEAGIGYKQLRLIFTAFATACVPAYFLSALWMPIPVFVYVLVVFAALVQMGAWIWLLIQIKQVNTHLKTCIPKPAYLISMLSLFAFTIKFILQLGSTIPTLSTIAFGFRPIVIGYLHLVLLGCISLFIIAYAIYQGVICINVQYKTALFIFITGIILNELVLMVQGVAAMRYIAVPYSNEILFGVALIIFSGVLLLNLRSTRRDIVPDIRTPDPAMNA